MLAIDTNVVVRFLTGDDPDQAARARAIIGAEPVFVCTTVLLETEWVLRRAHGFAPARIFAALRGFAGLPAVTLEDASLTARALAWAEGGMDFADALHLAKASGCEAFISFDRRLAQTATRAGNVAVRVP